MGYTLSFRETREVLLSDWVKFVEHCREILRDQKDVVRLGWDGEVFLSHLLAEASMDTIRFGGLSEESTFEPFSLSPSHLSGSCVTNRKPYTAVAVACLLAGRQWLGLDVSASGWDDLVGEGIDMYLRTGKACDRPAPVDRRDCLEWLDISEEDVPEDWLHWLHGFAPPPPLIVVCGLPRHGKDTFAGYLAEALGLPGGRSPGTCIWNTSDAIYRELSLRWGIPEESLRRVPKEDLRPVLVNLGDEMTKEDPAALVKARPPHTRIVVGVRRVAEFEAVPCRKVLVWVERKGGPAIEDNTEADTLSALADERLVFGDMDFAGMEAYAHVILSTYGN